MSDRSPTLADRLEDLLPQTQCTKCGYPACRPYAEAMASGEASYNQCHPVVRKVSRVWPQRWANLS